jgi:hypothetical protein
MTVDIVVPDRDAVVEVVTAPTSAIVDTALLGPPGPRGATGPQGPAGFTPTDPAEAFGIKAWNLDIACTSGNPGSAANTFMHGHRILLQSDQPISNVHLLSVGAPAGLVSGQNFVALYRANDRTLIGAKEVSADLAVIGLKTFALTGAPFNLPAGAYYVVVWFNATTAPTFLKGPQPATSPGYLGAGGLAEGRFARNNTEPGASVPAVLDAFTVAATHPLWVGLS